MYMILVVAAGGALGAVGRLLVGRAIFRLMGSDFPWATLSVNITGSFLIGMIVTFLASSYNLSHNLQGFLVIGVLGGFTTFSAFSLEVGLMLERNEIVHAGLYVSASLILGVSAMFMGLYAGRALA